MDQCTIDLEEETELQILLRRSGSIVNPPRKETSKLDLVGENLWWRGELYTLREIYRNISHSQVLGWYPGSWLGVGEDSRRGDLSLPFSCKCLPMVQTNRKLESQKAYSCC